MWESIMCNGSSKSKLFPSSFVMEGEFCKKDGEAPRKCSALLELAASDDLSLFKSEVEEKGCDVDEASFWYGRRIGSKKMGFEERTPLMISALFGSAKVLKYIIETARVDVNRSCGSDKATALHCAAAGGSSSSLEIVKLLIEASADINSRDGNGNKPIDVLPPPVKPRCNSRSKFVKSLLRGDNYVVEGDQSFDIEGEEKLVSLPSFGSEKKEYPVDVSLPDINNGFYSTDDFRMYAFKVKPCSRAYSHDWTECPFVHPGENARRRDPRKYPYSCVPCPEFRKGSCPKGDSCEYAHGVFESWLHPAQYRTRLCKDETGCTRKVCFFAHKSEELRPVYASTGSAMPSPKSFSASALDMTTLSPLSLNSPSLPLPATSTPPMSPLAASSSPKGMNLWQSKINLTPPSLQLPGSRLKSALSARDFDLELELLGLEKQASQQHQLMEEISRLSSPSLWNKEFCRTPELRPTNLDDVFGSLETSLLSPLHGLSMKASTPTQLQSPTGLQISNLNQLRASYPSSGMSSSPVRKTSSFGFDSSSAVAAAVMNSRSAAMTKRSQSFIDRGAVGQRSGLMGAAANSPPRMSNLSDWGSPDGKLDWGIQGDELNKLRKSASFGFRNNSMANPNNVAPPGADEPDVSWVGSLVKDAAPPEGYPQYMYIEQEQMVA
ncbi:zinc finger CCCH domain-containing protein 29-like [Syzygium oleosum]|uniref:zinc finger CCCH domain-containing protein 29-like n=1 Tax=Syzygium oleosum TaxID=219896 RepID=UPI0011D23F9E|nr:zinc finger CCCH domain-containing protein 29-like [Syzygium oleosum]